MRIAIITGASSGIGREFARQIPRLYKSLDELWVVARRTDRLKELVKESEVPVRIFDGDMMRDYIFSRIEKELERCGADIRMLVNAAGYGKIGAAEELRIDEQCEMVDLNCRSLTRLSLLCLPYMTKGSRIINIASAAAFAPQPGFAVYAATKSYVYSFSQAIREEVKDRGIVVTAVCPGPVDTEFFDRAGELKNSWKATVRAICVWRSHERGPGAFKDHAGCADRVRAGVDEQRKPRIRTIREIRESVQNDED